MILFLRVLIFCAFYIAGAPFAFADQSAHFFKSFEDIPLAPGIVEMTEETISFDKPEGRIIESVARIEDTDENSLIRFYDSALPQLGWKKMAAPQTYLRENEILKVEFEAQQGQKFLRITLTPVLDK
jgi:hypothetical protein